MHVATNAAHCLRAEHIVGRAPSADLRLEEPVVSGLHAALQWTPSGWTVRDLSSRNGVFVNGVRITAPTRLSPGDRVGFGEAAEQWQLADDHPPVAFAVSLEDGREVGGTASTLGLPDEGAAHTSVVRTGVAWMAESGEDDARAVEDRQIIEARGRWRLHLPLAGSHTTQAASLVHLDATRLRFLVSQDYEHIEVEVEHPAGPLRLAHYAANELLLVLAMARRDDETSAPAEHGWMHFDDLTASFRLTPMSPRDQNRIRQWIHKCRRRFIELGIADGERIVERRAGTRQVRLGTAHLEIVRAP